MTDYHDLVLEVDIPSPMRLIGEDGQPVFTVVAPTRGQQKKVEASRTISEMREILLGDQLEAALAFFDDKPNKVWVEFWSAYDAHFYGPGAGDGEGKSPS